MSIPEYHIILHSPDSDTGIIHAVYEKDNGNEVLSYVRYGIKILSRCGNRFHPMNLVNNIDGEDASLRSPWESAVTGWRPCRICFTVIDDGYRRGWDPKKDYERLRGLSFDEMWKEVDARRVL
jgi:hypothetical protein